MVPSICHIFEDNVIKERTNCAGGLTAITINTTSYWNNVLPDPALLLVNDLWTFVIDEEGNTPNFTKMAT